MRKEEGGGRKEEKEQDRWSRRSWRLKLTLIFLSITIPEKVLSPGPGLGPGPGLSAMSCLQVLVLAPGSDLGPGSRSWSWFQVLAPGAVSSVSWVLC